MSNPRCLDLKLDSGSTVKCDFGFLCSAGALSRYITLVDNINFVQQETARAPSTGTLTLQFMLAYAAKQKREVPGSKLTDSKNVAANPLVSILPGMVECETCHPVHTIFA